MSIKKTAFIAVTVVGLATAGAGALEPRTPAEFETQQRQQRMEDLADSHEMEVERRQSAGSDGVNAEVATKNGQSHRPPKSAKPPIKMRFRP